MAYEYLPLPRVSATDQDAVRKNQFATELNFKRLETEVAAATAAVILAPASDARNVIQPSGDFVPLTIRGNASQAVHLLSVQNSALSTLAYIDFRGNLVISRSNNGNEVNSTVQNSSDTANSHAALYLVCGGSSGGDPKIVFGGVSGVTTWAFGPDNSDSDAVVLSVSASLGTSNALRISTAGAITIPGTLGVSGATVLSSTLDVTGQTTAATALIGNITGGLAGQFACFSHSSFGAGTTYGFRQQSTGATAVNCASGQDVRIRQNDTDIAVFSSTGVVITGLTSTAASATGSAGLRIPHGTAPSSPVNGDIWTTSSGLYIRINGSTVGPLS